MQNFKLFQLSSVILLGSILLPGCSENKDSKSIKEQSITIPIPVKPNNAPKGPADEPEITVFRTVVSKAGLDHIFEGTGPFTAFIPTNDAFSKMGQEKLNTLLKDENHDKLVKLITYHILPGKYLTKNLQNRTYNSLNGNGLQVTVNGTIIKVNSGTIIKADIVGPNGVIHEIDSVLEPL